MRGLAHFERERYTARWDRTVTPLRFFVNAIFAPTPMAAKRIRGIPTLSALRKCASKLRRDLESLVKRFPEEGLAPENRIFPRLLSTRWRHLDEIYGPYDLRQTETVRWIEQYRHYVRDLEDYFTYVLLNPDLFNDLPFNGRSELSAVECIRNLNLQEEALTRLDADDRLGRLEAAVKRHSVQEVAKAVGLSPDTVSDLINRKVKHAKKTTMEKLEKHLPTLE
jgi:hypothetical protein